MLYIPYNEYSSGYSTVVISEVPTRMGDFFCRVLYWGTLIPAELLICFAEMEFPCRRICLPDVGLIMQMCLCFHWKGLAATELSSVVIILKLLF